MSVQKLFLKKTEVKLAIKHHKLNKDKLQDAVYENLGFRILHYLKPKVMADTEI